MEKDDWKKDFDADELKALGEATETPDSQKPAEAKPEEKPEGEKPAQPAPDKPADEKQGEIKPSDSKPETEQKKEDVQATADEQAAAVKLGFRIENGFVVDDDGTKIPPTRWKKLYYDDKEKGRQLEVKQKKLDLLKQFGRDEYYRLYPEEAPQGYQPKQKAPQQAQQALPIDDPRLLDVEINGGPYNGYTLRDVLQSDQEAGLKIYANYVQQVHATNAKAEAEVTRTKQAEETTVKNFAINRAKEYGVDDYEKLTAEKKQELAAKIQQDAKDLMEWQLLNNKFHLDLEDAWKLMNHDKIIEKARTEGAANFQKNLQKEPVLPSISGGGSVPKDTGFDSMLKWSRDEMAKHIDSLDDKAQLKFYKEAPASIKAKFQGLPWE